MAIIKREVREKLLSRTFIFMTILFPFLMFGGIGIQLALHQDEAVSKIAIVTENAPLTQSFQKEMLTSDIMKSGKLSMLFFTMNRQELKTYLDVKKKDLLEGQITGVVYIPLSSLKDKRIEYYSKTPTNLALSRKLEGPINKVLIDSYFSNRALSPSELDFARKSLDFSGFKVTKEQNVKEEGYGNLILAYIFSFLLYLSLLVTGQMMLQSVIEEKSNRIVEVILSSVSPKELMTGKIIGNAFTALIQMAIWISPIILIVSTTLIVLPPELAFGITLMQIGYLLVNFALGLLIYLSLFGMMGSIFDNPQDAQAGMWPIMILILIPFFIALSMMENPNSPIANIAALLPFSSIMVMPIKMTLVEVPIWQLILCLVINILTILVVFPIAGRIYRVGILITGKKPKWSEVIKWLQYKY
jgi:ABC-2 type transport system permease protein